MNKKERKNYLHLLWNNFGSQLVAENGVVLNRNKNDTLKKEQTNTQTREKLTKYMYKTFGNSENILNSNEKYTQ